MNDKLYSEEGYSAGVAIIIWSVVALIFSLIVTLESKNNFGAILALIQAVVFISLALQVTNNQKYKYLIPITALYSIDFAISAFIIKIPGSVVLIRILLLVFLVMGTIKSNNLLDESDEKDSEKDNNNKSNNDRNSYSHSRSNKNNNSKENESEEDFRTYYDFNKDFKYDSKSDNNGSYYDFNKDFNFHSSSNNNNKYKKSEKSNSKEKNTSNGKDNSNEPKTDSEEYYYKILNLKPGATFDEIKKSYLEQIKKYHPDRVDNLGEEFLDLALKRTKEIVIAYQYFKKKFGIH